MLALIKEPYNAQQETERKRALSMVLSQSKHQERKDAEVLAEAKRIQELRMLSKLQVYLRSYASDKMVEAANSTAGPRSIKRVEEALQDLVVNLKPKVPTKAVCAEHLERRKEILTLLNLQKQIQHCSKVGQIENARSETCERVFENCFVPEENVLGEEGKGKSGGHVYFSTIVKVIPHTCILLQETVTLEM